ncbi:MAG: peptidyl-prolyl cis-trans isomerase SurA [Dokdonia sp.]|jgi:peptidyl-prolyl cis-trans isomerase SurA
MNNISKTLFFLILTSLSNLTYAQKDKDVLLTINKEDISVGNFKRVYLKNLNLVQDTSQKDVTSYLELYTDYKLKIQEAYNLGLNDKESYIQELKGYQVQLSRNYIMDIDVTEALVKEAYDRLAREVSARHILVHIKEGASPADTLKAFSKIQDARLKIVAGEDFVTVAKAYSDDPSAQTNGGDLGWFKAFKMLYAFETAAYQTTLGEISQPIRTRYGYHIVQPTAERTGEGDVTAAHIMIALKQSDNTVDPEKRINKIYALLGQGQDFAKLARSYSEDKKSGKKGGILNKFSKGQLSSPLFENEVFALTDEGSYTQPFKTDFGWHIAKLLKKHPLGTYEQMKYELEGRVKRDSRAKIITDSLATQLFERYEVKSNAAIVTFFSDVVTPEVLQKKWVFDTTLDGLEKQALQIRDTTLAYMDVGLFLEGEQQLSKPFPTVVAFVQDKVDLFFESRVRRYHLAHLAVEDPEFGALLTEYKEGLLLFDLMASKVWNQAKTDTLGLQAFYAQNKDKYQWAERMEFTVLSATEKDMAQRGRALLKEGQTIEEIESLLNSKGEINVLFTSRTVPTEEVNLPEGVTLSKGISAIIKGEDFSVYNVTNILPAGTKTLEEVKGKVSSDFQKEVETKWIEKLRAKSNIKVNKKTLKKLTKQLND